MEAVTFEHWALQQGVRPSVAARQLGLAPAFPRTRVKLRDRTSILLTFAWKMTRPVNLFALYSGLPLVGLASVHSLCKRQ